MARRIVLFLPMLGAAAAGIHPSLESTMAAMTRVDRIVQPDPRVAAYHDAKYLVYRRMIDDNIAYRDTMRDA